MYHDVEKNQLLKFDERGDEKVVVKFETNQIKVHLKEVRQFLAIKEMHLAIYFDFQRDSDLLSDDFPIELEDKNDLTFYELSADSFPVNKHKSLSRLIGKKLIPPFSLNSSVMRPFKAKKDYIDFIIGLDENGDLVKYSCNPHELANPDAPYNITPVFFRREVLTKYYANPERYSVEDGYLRCQGLWGLRIDNNHHEYIVVFLGDLGIDLPSEEQMYWCSYNVPPEGKISKTNFKRSFLAEFSEPEQIDLIFQKRFIRFSKKWEEIMGWSLFRELAEADDHLFKTLRIPLTNSQPEFDSQILALTKLMIDSLNEKEIVKATPGGNTETKGISKLEQFLKARQYPHYQQYIDFLRNLQSLRSSSVAHRKGDKYKKIAKTFGLKQSNRADVLKKILVKSTDFILSLESHFLTQS